MAGYLLPLATTLIGALLRSGQKDKKTQVAPASTVTQEPLRSPQQEEAENILLNLGKTGKFGDIKLGEKFSGKLRETGVTGIERSGLDELSGIVGGGDPGIFGTGIQELQNLFSTDKFDPFSEKGVFRGFKKNVLRELGESEDRLKRHQAAIGGIYSGGTAKELGLLQERGQESLQGKLAELYQKFGEQKLRAIPTALGAGVQQQGLGLERVGASQRFGGLERNLENEKLIAEYNEFKRTRGEKLNQINLLSNIAGRNVPFGFKSVTLPAQYENEASPWAAVIDALIRGGAQGLGQSFATAQ